MKIAMIILGIIGALIALVGSVVTMIGGFGGTAAGMLGENNGVASSGAFVFWSGAVAVALSVLALIFSVIGGSAKKKNVIFIFSLATLITGLLNIYLYNWFSGSIIAVAGLLGMIGAKDGIDQNQPIKKSPLLYAVMSVLVILVGASALVKNGKSFTESDSVVTAVETPAPMLETVPAVPATEATPFEKLTFSGRQSFNFMGGNGTEQVITALANRRVRVESLGTTGSSVDFEGPFTNPLRINSDYSLLFKENKVFMTDGTTIQKGCKEQEQDCSSELYPAEEISQPLNLASAMADTNAITCRYNESENMCGAVDGESAWYAPPAQFAEKEGYATIIKQETFDEPGTSATYLKMTVKN